MKQLINLTITVLLVSAAFSAYAWDRRYFGTKEFYDNARAVDSRAAIYNRDLTRPSQRQCCPGSDVLDLPAHYERGERPDYPSPESRSYVPRGRQLFGD